MKKTLLLFIVSFCIAATQAQAPNIQWQKCFGGTGNESAASIEQTTDGGYIIAGQTNSSNGDVHNMHANSFNDYWIVKLNYAGDTIWTKCLGGTGEDIANLIKQTSDGGYIVGGSTDSNDGYVVGNHGNLDCWIIKLNSTGDTVWTKCLGGSASDYTTSIEQTTDGGYIIAVSSASNDGDVAGNNGGTDYWIVKLSSTGNILWTKSLGGTGNETATSIKQTTDGGYIVAGGTTSTNGYVTGNHGGRDYWIIKLNNIGDTIWTKCLGGTADEGLSYSDPDIQQTIDGGYILSGYTYSNNGDVSGNHGAADYWIVKLNSSGSITWQKCFGGSDFELATSIKQTADGGYVVTGYANSANQDVFGIHRRGFYWDYWVVKLNSTGGIEWQQCLGGFDSDFANSIQQAADGNYIIAGSSFSTAGDVTGNHGGSDFWIVKIITPTHYVWMKDTQDDTGLEPDPATALQNMWESPYIWIRNTQDANLQHQHEHENPVLGQSNWVYVKLHNEFNRTVDDTLKLYWANAATGLSWPNDWHLLTEMKVANFTAHSTRVVEYPWANLPGAGHFCMLARWVSPTDPMTTPETADINANVRGNNNIVWRNLNIIDLTQTAAVEASFIVRNQEKEKTEITSLIIKAPVNKTKSSFTQNGQVLIQLDKNLLYAWEQGGNKGIGFNKTEDGFFLISAEVASFDNLILKPGTEGNVKIIFKKLPITQKGIFYIEAVQQKVNNQFGQKAKLKPRIVGAVSYEIRVGKGKY